MDKWLLPDLGDLFLADVGNAALKELIEKMASAALAAQSIVNYTKVVKMVRCEIHVADRFSNPVILRMNVSNDCKRRLAEIDI